MAITGFEVGEYYILTDMEGAVSVCSPVPSDIWVWNNLAMLKVNYSMSPYEYFGGRYYPFFTYIPFGFAVLYSEFRRLGGTFKDGAALKTSLERYLNNPTIEQDNKLFAMKAKSCPNLSHIHYDVLLQRFKDAREKAAPFDIPADYIPEGLISKKENEEKEKKEHIILKTINFGYNYGSSHNSVFAPGQVFYTKPSPKFQIGQWVCKIGHIWPQCVIKVDDRNGKFFYGFNTPVSTWVEEENLRIVGGTVQIDDPVSTEDMVKRAEIVYERWSNSQVAKKEKLLLSTKDIIKQGKALHKWWESYLKGISSFESTYKPSKERWKFLHSQKRKNYILDVIKNIKSEEE